jgi:hypothetical protein
MDLLNTGSSFIPQRTVSVADLDSRIFQLPSFRLAGGCGYYYACHHLYRSDYFQDRVGLQQVQINRTSTSLPREDANQSYLNGFVVFLWKANLQGIPQNMLLFPGSRPLSLPKNILRPRRLVRDMHLLPTGSPSGA